MRPLRPLILPAVALAIACTAAPSPAVSPQNPYRSFNLSGINYGSMQWERAHREGRRVWPSSTAPTRRVTQTPGVWVGGGGAGAIVQGGGPRFVPRSAPRLFRRWRR